MQSTMSCPHANLAAALLVALALTPACASGGRQGVAPRLEFPSDASLAEIASAPAPDLSELATPETALVSTWQLRGPLPDPGTAASLVADDALSTALSAATKRRFSLAMSCYARELGAFLSEHELPPSTELRTFMRARCGVLSTSVGETWSTTELGGGELPPPDIAATHLREAFAGAREDGDNGVWYGQRGDQILWVFTTMLPEVEIAEYATRGGDKPALSLRGRVLGPLEWIHGKSTIGDYQVGECVPDPELPTAPPEFALVCPLSLRDEYALVQIGGGAPGRVLGRNLYLNMVVLQGPADTFHSRVAIDGLTPSDSLVTMVNELRARSELGPLRESAAQSRVVDDLLPHYFAATKADDGALLDKIALGVMAGWHVDGLKSGASFHSFRAAASVPMSQTLADLLALPSYRAALLDPRADVVALATSGAGEGLDRLDRLGLLSTYDLYAPRDFGPHAARFLDELDRQRVAGAKAPIIRVDGDGPNKILDDALDKVSRGEKRPKDALDGALRAFSERTGRSFYGLIYRASVLDGWRPEFESTIMNARAVEAAVRIGFFTPDDAAWGEYLVFMVFAVK